MEDGVNESNKIKSNLKAMTGVDQAGSFAIQRHISYHQMKWLKQLKLKCNDSAKYRFDHDRKRNCD